MTIQSDMALMAAGSYWDVRNGEIDPQTGKDTDNDAPIPPGWKVLTQYNMSASGGGAGVINSSGFSARVYLVNNAGDGVIENLNEGTDLVNASVTHTLAANVENITLTGTTAINATGNGLDNTLTGNGGINVLTGLAGNDLYVVGTGDTTIEAANAGTDSMQSAIAWTLANNVENLTLTGTAAVNGTGNTGCQCADGQQRCQYLDGQCRR